MRVVLTVCILLAAGSAAQGTAGHVEADPSTLVADMRQQFAAAQALRRQGRNVEAGQTYENAVARLLGDKVSLKGGGCGGGAATCTRKCPCGLWARLRAHRLDVPAARATLNAITSYRAAGREDRAGQVAVAALRWAPACCARTRTLAPSRAPCVLAHEAELLLRIALSAARAIAAQSSPQAAATVTARCALATASLALLAGESPVRAGAVPPASFAVETALVVASVLPPRASQAVQSLLALRTGIPPRPADVTTLHARARSAPARAVASFTLARALSGTVPLSGIAPVAPVTRPADAEAHYASLWHARSELAARLLPSTLLCDALRQWGRLRTASGGPAAGAAPLRTALASGSAPCAEASVDLATMLVDAGRARQASPYLLAASEAQDRAGRLFASLGTALRAALTVDPAPLAVGHAASWRARLHSAAHCAVRALRALPAPGAGETSAADSSNGSGPLTEFLSAFGAGLPHFARYYHGGAVARTNRAAADVASEVARLVGVAALLPAASGQQHLSAAASPPAQPDGLLRQAERVCHDQGGRHPACALVGGKEASGTAPLRIAVVSAHLRPHSVARFLLPLLEALAHSLPPRVSLHIEQVAAVRSRSPMSGAAATPAESRILDPLRAALAARGDASALTEHRGGTASAVGALRSLSRLWPHVILLPDLGMDAVTWLAAAAVPAPVTAATWGHPITSGHRGVGAFVVPSPHLVRWSDLAAPTPSFTEPVASLHTPGAAAVMCPAPAPASAAAWVRGHGPAAAAARARLGLHRRVPLLACLQAPAKVGPLFAASLGASLAAAERACAHARVPPPVLLLLAGPDAGSNVLARAVDAASGRDRAPAAAASRLAHVLEALHAAWAASRLGAGAEEVVGATASLWPAPHSGEDGQDGLEDAPPPSRPVDSSAAAAVRRCVREADTGAGGDPPPLRGCSPWHWLAAAQAWRAGGRRGKPSCADARRVVAVAVPWPELRRRLRVLPRQPRAQFEALIFAADALLDSYPVSGGVTTLDAMARGAPVVTFPAAQSTLRFTRAFLASAGLADWVAPSHTAFVQRTARLAANPQV